MIHRTYLIELPDVTYQAEVEIDIQIEDDTYDTPGSDHREFRIIELYGIGEDGRAERIDTPHLILNYGAIYSRIDDRVYDEEADDDYMD